MGEIFKEHLNENFDSDDLPEDCIKKLSEIAKIDQLLYDRNFLDMVSPLLIKAVQSMILRELKINGSELNSALLGSEVLVKVVRRFEDIINDSDVQLQMKTTLQNQLLRDGSLIEIFAQAFSTELAKSFVNRLFDKRF